MALIKSVTLSNGYTAEYWNIQEPISVNKDGSAIISLSLYKDAASRLSGKDAFKVVRAVKTSFRAPAGTFDISTPLELWPVAYTYIKSLEEFSGAVDA